MATTLVNPYCSVAQVQTEIGNSDTSLVAQLEDAINQASRWIDEYKRRDFYQHDFTSTALVIDVFDGAVLGDTLWLPYKPIISISEVKVAGQVWTVNADYAAKATRLVALNGIWPIGIPPNQIIEIKGKFGYAQAKAEDVPTGLPANVNRAAIMIAAAFSGLNVKEVVDLDGSKTTLTQKEIPQAVYELLGGRKMIL